MKNSIITKKLFVSGLLVSLLSLTSCDSLKAPDEDVRTFSNVNNTDNQNPNNGDGNINFTPKFVVTSNPEGSTDDVLLSISDDLTQTFSLFQIGEIGSLQSFVFGRDNEGYVSFEGDIDSENGIILISGTTEALTGDSKNVTAKIFDKAISPKGITYNTQKDRVFVADFGDADNSPAVRVYQSIGSQLNLLFSIEDTGTQQGIWDLAYNEETDTLYVTGTNGNILVYEKILENKEQSSLTSEITLTKNGTKYSTELRGISLDVQRDALIVTDIGRDNSDDDGKVLVLAKVSSPRSRMEIFSEISGIDTNLGNPVDVYLEGSDIYVAEKANDSILKFEGIFQKRENPNASPSTSLEIKKPESIAVVPK